MQHARISLCPITDLHAREEASRCLVLLASVSAIHGTPTPCPLRFVMQRTGLGRERCLALLETLVTLGIIDRTPHGWAMTPDLHASCMDAAEVAG